MNGKILVSTVSNMLDKGLSEEDIIEKISQMEQEWIDKKNVQHG